MLKRWDREEEEAIVADMGRFVEYMEEIERWRPIHELMREWANAINPIGEAYDYLSCVMDLSRDPSGAPSVFATIADIIERDCLYRPLAENSTVQFGDRIEGLDEPCTGIEIFDDGSGRLLCPSSEVTFPEYEDPDRDKCLHRSSSPVDCDGIEIVVGETLWGKANHLQYEVVELKPGEGRDVVVAGPFGNAQVSGVELTHEPDSPDLLLGDMSDVWTQTNGILSPRYRDLVHEALRHGRQRHDKERVGA